MGKPVANAETLKLSIDHLIDFILDEELFYIGKEVGRRLRWGEFDVLGVLEDVAPELKVVDAPGYDIFGQPLTKKYNYECECPNCHRTLAAARFAPHLEKCMGMGRNSSRVASRRLAAASGSNNATTAEPKPGTSQNMESNSQSTTELGSEDDAYEDIEDDEEWTMEKKKKTKKSEKIAPKKKVVPQKFKASEAGSHFGGAGPNM